MWWRESESESELEEEEEEEEEEEQAVGRCPGVFKNETKSKPSSSVTHALEHESRALPKHQFKKPTKYLI
jgi:hypothetical protein